MSQRQTRPHVLKAAACRAPYLALLSLVTACEPQGSGPVAVLVADYDPNADAYRPILRTIESLQDAGELRGRVARIQGKGNITLNVPELVLPTDRMEAYRDQLLLESGETVRPRWVEVDGALYPRDFDTLAMTTLYHHIERAADLFADLGTVFEPLDVYYLAAVHYTAATGREEAMTDNALYAFGVRWLFMLKFEELQDLPLGMNRGVVVHEYSHLAFDELVFDDEARERLLVGTLADRTGNLLRAITEGLADFYASVETGDPNPVRFSLRAALVVPPRDLGQPAVYDDLLLEDASFPAGSFNPYPSGTALASALWRLPVDRHELGLLLVEAQRQLGERMRAEPPWDEPTDDFGFAWLLDPLVGGLAEEDQTTACAIFEEQLPAAQRHMTLCP